MAEKCKFLKQDGKYCKGWARTGRLYCLFHDQSKDSREILKEGAGRGGRAGALTVLAEVSQDQNIIKSFPDLSNDLANVYFSVKTGKLSYKVGNVLGNLAKVLGAVLTQKEQFHPNEMILPKIDPEELKAIIEQIRSEDSHRQLPEAVGNEVKKTQELKVVDASLTQDRKLHEETTKVEQPSQPVGQPQPEKAKPVAQQTEPHIRSRIYKQLPDGVFSKRG